MLSEPVTFALRPSVLRFPHVDGSVTRYPESHFLDYLVGGSSFVDLMKGRGNFVTPLNRPWLESVPAALEALRGRTTVDGLGPGRVALLVCGVCGDLACGALTAAMHRDEGVVVWSDFSWEGSIEPSPLEHEPLKFALLEYDGALGDAYEQVASMPYDALAHRGRRFLWPWQWGWRLPPH